MVKNVAVSHHKEQEEDNSFQDHLMNFHLKVLCYAGMLPHEEICNTPRKIKLYRVYQITMYILYFPLLFSQVYKLYHKSEDLLETVETIIQILIGITSCILPLFMNWKEASEVICKLRLSFKTKTHSKKMDVLRAIEHKAKLLTITVLIVGKLVVFSDLFEVFFLYSIEELIGAEHKHKMNPNAANIYVSLLLEKYPFGSWVPFYDTSVTVHLVLYIYAIFPLLGIVMKIGIMLTLLVCKIMYVSVQFQFVNMSLENLDNMKDSDCQIQDKAFNTLQEQHTSEELKYKILQVPVRDGESDQTIGKVKSLESHNKKLCSERNTSPVDSVKHKEYCTPSDRSDSDSKSSPEDCLVEIIKEHQEAIW
jgi:uncharacterized membrane protein YciS (DUF1049 family)